MSYSVNKFKMNNCSNCVNKLCKYCFGCQYEKIDWKVSCDLCKGKGKVKIYVDESYEGRDEYIYEKCNNCLGTCTVNDTKLYPCYYCNQTGKCLECL